MIKKYLSIDDQINLLKSKNIFFKNEKKAKTILEKIGYYKLINGYKIPFKQKIGEKAEYKNDVTFEDIYGLYEFDRKLKTIVFGATSSIEIRIKSYISEIVSSKYGVARRNYLKEENYSSNTNNNSFTFKQLKEAINKSIRTQLNNNNPSIVWYSQNYKDYPFWVVANTLTFGAISKMFTILKDEDKITIAKKFNIPFGYLESYLFHINMIRNICAHNSVLYRYKSKNSLPQKIINIRKYYQILNISINKFTGRFERGSNDFLGTIIVFKILLSKEDYNLFKTQLNGLLIKLKRSVKENFFSVIMAEMGLSTDFKELNLLK